MDEAVAAFDALRNRIGSATLVDMNKTLIYDDVGIALMQYALELCAKHFDMSALKVNASSSVNFISTLLDSTPLNDQLDWNGAGKGFVQKPDAVFELSFTTDGGTQRTMLIYYESDAGSKANPKDRKQAARKLYQSTCGCREINPDMPAVSVRANVFMGPKPEQHLAGSAAAELGKTQRSAQNALDFLQQLAVAHVWLCCQICLLVAKQKGSFAGLALEPRSKTRYDLHLLIGELVVPDGLEMQLFETPHVSVDIRKADFQVAGAALVQCLCVQRFEQTTLSAAVREVYASQAPLKNALRGMPTVQDLWSLLHHCEMQSGAQGGAGVWGTGAELHTGGLMDYLRKKPAAIVDGAAAGAAPGAAPAPGAATPVAPAATALATLTKFKWAESGALVIGPPGPGLAAPRGKTSTATGAEFEHLQAPKPVGGARNAIWKQGMALVAEYYDAVCAALHTRFFADMTWVPADHYNYLADLKKLKAESRRDISVLQSRAQTAGLEQLGMLNSLGIKSGAEHLNLSNACIRSLYDTLPAIDPRLEKYIATFHAPNVALFLRLIRCTNLMAFEHLTKTHGTPELKDEFQRRLRHFPLGTAADLDYIMQYTASNAKNVHSIYLKPVKHPVTQSANVSRSGEYAWVSDLLDSISKNPTNLLDSMLPNSPLARKLLLCHRKVYELLHSVVVRPLDNNAPAIPVVSETDTVQMHRRIVRGLMQDKTMYYVAAVERHVEVFYAANGEENRGASVDVSSNTQLRALTADGSDESDQQHIARLKDVQIQFTRMTWPLRDLNVYTRIALPVVVFNGECQSIAYPGNFSFAHSDMDTHEKEMYDWLEKVQNSQRLRRQREEEQLETDTVVCTLPLIPLPSQMLSQCRQLNERQGAVLREANNYAEAVDTELHILQAWRWKSLLLQTNLLSALNGICEELKTSTRPIIISAFDFVGLEAGRDSLEMQDFIVTSPTRSPQYLVRERLFDAEQTNAKYKNRSINTDKNLVELLKCKFSLKQRGSKLFSKLIRRSTSEHKNEECLLKKKGLYLHGLDMRDVSLKFKSTVTSSPYLWFEFL